MAMLASYSSLAIEELSFVHQLCPTVSFCDELGLDLYNLWILTDIVKLIMQTCCIMNASLWSQYCWQALEHICTQQMH